MTTPAPTWQAKRQPTTVAQALAQTLSLLARKDAWTRGATARDKRGERVIAEAPEACSWCLLGALQRVTAHPGTAARKLFDKSVMFLIDLLGGQNIHLFNDRSSYSDVMRFLRRARAVALEAGL